MDKETLYKLASVLDQEELEAVVEVLTEDLEKTAEEEKLAELEAQYALGEYTAAAFVDELEKIAEAIESEDSGDDLEKVASAYEDLGRQMAHEYFTELIKEAEEEMKEEEDEDEDKEEKKEAPQEEKMQKAKEKLLAAVAAKKAE